MKDGTRRLLNVLREAIPLAREEAENGHLEFDTFGLAGPACGTVACLMGWAAQTPSMIEEGLAPKVSFPERSGFGTSKENPLIFYFNGQPLTSFKQIALFFGITLNMTEQIFGISRMACPAEDLKFREEKLRALLLERLLEEGELLDEPAAEVAACKEKEAREAATQATQVMREKPARHTECV